MLIKNIKSLISALIVVASCQSSARADISGLVTQVSKNTYRVNVRCKKLMESNKLMQEGKYHLSLPLISEMVKHDTDQVNRNPDSRTPRYELVESNIHLAQQLTTCNQAGLAIRILEKSLIETTDYDTDFEALLRTKCFYQLIIIHSIEGSFDRAVGYFHVYSNDTVRNRIEAKGTHAVPESYNQPTRAMREYLYVFPFDWNELQANLKFKLNSFNTAKRNLDEMLQIIHKYEQVKVISKRDINSLYVRYYNLLSSFYYLQGNFVAADASLVKSHAYIDNATPLSGILYYLNNLALIKSRLGDFDEAIILTKAAYILHWTKPLQITLFQLWTLNVNLAQNYIMRAKDGDLAQAKFLIELTLDKIEEKINQAFFFLKESERAPFLSHYRFALGCYCSLSRKNNQITNSMLYDRVLKYKAASFVHTNEITRLTQVFQTHPLISSAATTPFSRNSKEFCSELIGTLSLLHHTLINSPSSEHLLRRDYINRLNEFTHFFSNPDDLFIFKSVATSQSVRKDLKNHTLFLDFFESYQIPILQNPKQGFRSEKTLTLFVVTSDSPVRVIHCDHNSDTLADIIQQWNLAVDPALSQDKQINEADLFKISQNISNGLGFQQITDVIQNCKHLVVSPDGPLWKMPFEAFPGTVAGSKYFINHFTSIRYIISSIHLSQTEAPLFVYQPTMLLISDIDYNNRFPKLSFVDYTSKLEMQLKTAYPDLDVRKLVFADATLSNVTRELLQAPDIFYFCGHLHFQPYSIHKLNPAIAMQSMQIPNVFFPLSSSFPHLPKDDFQLYQSYDLPAPLLSVFLCCGGTQGSLLSGESVLGFPRTILMNGGHTVVTTMWDIKPEHVNQFFPKVSADIFNNGISVEEALGNAQRDLISQNNYLSHPRYWAGKIAIGHGGIIVKPQQSTQPPIQLETGSDSYQQASNYWFYVCGAIGILAFLVIVMLFRLKVLPWQRR